MSSSESEESTSSGLVRAAPGGRPPKTWILCATCGWAEWERPDVYERENKVILLCRWCFRVPAPPHSWGEVGNAEHFLRRMKLLPHCVQHVAVTYLIAAYLTPRDFGCNYCRDEGMIDGQLALTSVFEIGHPFMKSPDGMRFESGRLEVHPVTGELLNPPAHVRLNLYL